MNILLIGHEGYLGHGLHTFLRRNHRVIGWDKKEDLFKLSAENLARENVEVLINLSVLADRQSKAYLIDTPPEEVTVHGARHIARILKGSQIAWFQFSTREVLGPVYGSKDVVKTKAGYRPKFLVDETFPYVPQNFYGKTKIVAEFISESHPYSNIIRLTTGYTDFNGPGSNWVLAVLRTVAEGKPVTLTRGGEQFRDPLHTDDLGRLIEKIYERKVFGERFHAGGGKKNLISLKEFVRVADPHVKITRAPGGDYGYAFDIKKAKRLVDWEPRVLIRDKIPVIASNIRTSISQPQTA